MNNIELPTHSRELVSKVEQTLQAASQYYLADAQLLSHLYGLGFRADCVFDVGASNTIWSVMAHVIYPKARFELFEPLAEIAPAYKSEKLLHPAVLNFVTVANHRTHAIALGNENKTARFNQFEQSAGSTSLELNWESDAFDVIEVPMRRMEDFVREENLPRPQILKLDTQGAELEILKGSGDLLDMVEVVFIETWLQKGYGAHTPLLLNVANLLHDKGLELFDVGDCFRDEAGLIVTYDTVFVRSDAGWLRA